MPLKLMNRRDVKKYHTYYLLKRCPVARNLMVLPRRDIGHLELDVLKCRQHSSGCELTEWIASLRHDLVQLLGLLDRHVGLELPEAAQVVDGGALVLLL